MHGPNFGQDMKKGITKVAVIGAVLYGHWSVPTDRDGEKG